MTEAHFEALPRNTAVPIYQLIKDAVVDKIRAGEWLPGTRVPSENALAAELGVSRMTAHRALRELTQHGLLTRVHGVGTFVAEPPQQARASLSRAARICSSVIPAAASGPHQSQSRVM